MEVDAEANHGHHAVDGVGDEHDQGHGENQQYDSAGQVLEEGEIEGDVDVDVVEELDHGAAQGGDEYMYVHQIGCRLPGFSVFSCAKRSFIAEVLEMLAGCLL